MSAEQNTTQQLLKDIRQSLISGLIGKKCIGYQTLVVTNSAILRLTIPEGAQSAEITVESAGSTNTNAAVRYTLDNLTDPVTGAVSGAGIPLGDYDTIEITNNTNLYAFKVIAVDGANSKYLKINYYA